MGRHITSREINHVSLDQYADIYTAMATIGTEEVKFYITSHVDLSTSLTIPSNVSLSFSTGAIITVTAALFSK